MIKISAPAQQLLPSCFQIGDAVRFNTMAACGTKVNVYTAYALVVGVNFECGKVLYDLALEDSKTGFHEACPIRHVDSMFVCAIKPA